MKVSTHSRFSQIGIDRLVRLQWLDQAVKLVQAGNDYERIKRKLQDNLKDSFRSENPNVRGSIDKTITILLKVWLKAPSDVEPLRISGLKLLKDLPQEYDAAVHWGMLMAAYPFWGNVAIQVGRLLKLQGSAAATQVQRRMREQYGERETVTRRVRYVLRSYVDWGVLKETGSKGVYAMDSFLVADDVRLTAWLMAALLHAQAKGSAPLRELIQNPGLFPLRLAPANAKSLVAASANIDLLRQGLDQDIVLLRREGNVRLISTPLQLCEA